jgi:CheY-like chemotaxis protein
MGRSHRNFVILVTAKARRLSHTHDAISALAGWTGTFSERRPMSKQIGTALCIGRGPIELNLRCALLRENGWNVVSSGSGHEGVLTFAREKFDIVIVDLNEDGSEAALITGELKRQQPRIPVVLIVSGKPLVEGATAQASAVVLKAEESRTLPPIVRGLVRPS